MFKFAITVSRKKRHEIELDNSTAAPGKSKLK